LLNEGVHKKKNETNSMETISEINENKNFEMKENIMEINDLNKSDINENKINDEINKSDINDNKINDEINKSDINENNLYDDINKSDINDSINIENNIIDIKSEISNNYSEVNVDNKLKLNDIKIESPNEIEILLKNDENDLYNNEKKINSEMSMNMKNIYKAKNTSQSVKYIKSKLNDSSNNSNSLNENDLVKDTNEKMEFENSDESNENIKITINNQNIFHLKKDSSDEESDNTSKRSSNISRNISVDKTNEKKTIPYKNQFERFSTQIRGSFMFKTREEIEIIKNSSGLKIRLTDFQQYNGGIKSESNEEEEVYYLGIIDLLQEWNDRKIVENIFKTTIMNQDKNGLSAVNPKAYSKRFIDFVSKLFE
jgi:hypothetical protein